MSSQSFFKVQTKYKGQIKIVLFTEHSIDTLISENLKQDLKQAFQSKDNNELKYIILSFQHVNFIDSSGLSAILSFWKFVSFHFGDVVVTFASCSKKIENFFKLCKLQHIFNIYKTVEDSINHKSTEDFI